MNECGLVLSDSPLVGELSQEGGRTGDRGAILHNLNNRPFDMCDSTVCVRAKSVEVDLLPWCLLEPFQVKTAIRHLEKQGPTRENKQVFKMRRKEMEKGFKCVVCHLEEKKLWRGDQFPELCVFMLGLRKQSYLHFTAITCTPFFHRSDNILTAVSVQHSD